MVHRENPQPQLKRCSTKTQRITSKCSYSTVWYLLKAVLLFPVLKNVCYLALWFSVPGSRSPQAAVYHTFSFVKAEPAAIYCTAAQIQTCILWNVLEMSSCPAKAIFRQRNNAVFPLLQHVFLWNYYLMNHMCVTAELSFICAAVL